MRRAPLRFALHPHRSRRSLATGLRRLLRIQRHPGGSLATPSTACYTYRMARALDDIRGTLARIKSYRAESGWLSAEVRTAASSRVHGVRITVVGFVVGEPFVGMEVFAQGQIVVHDRFGEQLQAEEFVLTPPRNAAARSAYLRHILPELTIREAWVAAQFEGDLARALVPDLPDDKAEALRSAWLERALDPAQVQYLRELGVDLSLAIATVRYFTAVGERVEEVVARNPYRLMESGLPWSVVDRTALRLGCEHEASARIIASLTEAARLWTLEGHTLVSRDDLRCAAAKLVTVMPETIDCYVEQAVEARALVAREMAGRPRFQQPAMHAAESSLAQDVARLDRERPITPRPDKARIAEICGFTPDSDQLSAIQCVFERGLSIVTGGPGCGKTTVTRVLVHAFPGNAWLAAPTGMGAKRLGAVTGRDAVTIHSMLGGTVENDRWSFSFTRETPLPLHGALLVIDEFSMVDTDVATALLAAVPDDCTVVIVGDADQLPSVGPGSVLADLIAAGVPATHLRHIHRQGTGSPIPYIARNVIEGIAPLIPEDGLARFIAVRSDTVADEVFAVVRGMIDAGVTLDQIRVLSPTWGGPFGVDALNAGLQKIWNKENLHYGGILGTQSTNERGKVFEEYLYIGDRVLVMKNDHQRKVFNGDILRVVDCGMHGKTPWLDAVTDSDAEIRFEGPKQIGQLRLAYATTVHRAQGSEFPHVVVALVEAQRRMLRRRVLYTAVSRAQRTLTIIGQRHAIDLAVKDAGGVRLRETGLCDLVRATQCVQESLTLDA